MSLVQPDPTQSSKSSGEIFGVELSPNPPTMASAIEKTHRDLDIEMDAQPASPESFTSSVDKIQFTREEFRAHMCGTKNAILYEVDTQLTDDPSRQLSSKDVAASVAASGAHYYEVTANGKATGKYLRRETHRVQDVMTKMLRKEGSGCGMHQFLREGSRCLSGQTLEKLQYYKYRESRLRDNTHPPPPPRQSEHSQVKVRQRQRPISKLRPSKSSTNMGAKSGSRDGGAAHTTARPKTSKRRKKSNPGTLMKGQRQSGLRSLSSVGEKEAVLASEQKNLPHQADEVPTEAQASGPTAAGNVKQTVTREMEYLDMMFNDDERAMGVNDLLFRQESDPLKAKCEHIYQELKGIVMRHLDSRGFAYWNSPTLFDPNPPGGLESTYLGITGDDTNTLRNRGRIVSNCTSIQLFSALTSQFLMMNVFQAPNWLETFPILAGRMKHNLGLEARTYGDKLLSRIGINTDTFIRQLFFSNCRSDAFLSPDARGMARTTAMDLAHCIDSHLGRIAYDGLTYDLAHRLQDPVEMALKLKCLLSAYEKDHEFVWYTPGSEANRRNMEFQNGEVVVLTTFPALVLKGDMGEEVVYKAQVECIGTAAAVNNMT